ncbi:phosphotransferase family protein [Isoptericola sp. BMS4]|uniref:phosphotransferase family protein n=1 Tax=Isoptericola sp. BMS4 TaxID=2527875 RepID=UPI00196A3B80|nr:aminoglycoside phosphotransferase family protein [Isoptericola sp. BMS4]
MPPSIHTHAITVGETEVRKRYVSWSRGEADREWTCLTLLAAHAPGVAPRPLRRETEDDAPVVVMERLPGTPLGGAPLTTPQTASLGGVLRRLYSVPLAAVRETALGERPYGPSTLPGALGRWLSGPHDLSPCQDAGLVRTAVAAAREWLAAGGELPSPRLVSLGISDLNPANVLWDGRTCRLVDFEDGGLTDPAFELADHTEHLAGRLARFADPRALVHATGLSPDEVDRWHAYRPVWATFWLAMLLPGNGGYRRNPPGTTEMQARHVLALLR